MNIVGRVDGSGRCGFRFGDRRLVDSVAVERLFHGGKTQRPIGNADRADMDIANSFPPSSSKNNATPASAKSPRRRANSRKPKRRCRGHAGKRISVMISSGFSAVVNGPRKKSLASMTRSPALPTNGDLGLAGDGDARQFGGRIGMRQTAADRAAIADLIMRDMLDGLHQERMGDRKLRMFENVAPAHHGAERNGVARRS